MSSHHPFADKPFSLTRRDALLGSAALAAASAMPKMAWAAADPSALARSTKAW